MVEGGDPPHCTVGPYNNDPTLTFESTIITWKTTFEIVETSYNGRYGLLNKLYSYIWVCFQLKFDEAFEQEVFVLGGNASHSILQNYDIL